MPISETLKQLLVLLADGKFHSGTVLSAAVGISRSAIWKHLQLLPDLGLELTALSGKGYKLQQPLQLLERSRIDQYLAPQSLELINHLEIHDSLASTNSYLLERARHNAKSGQVCIAEYQTAGKGRRGRQWISPFGHNIYASILWCYQDNPSAIAGLSLALGVAVVRALQELGVNAAGLKWPNDIYFQQKKLAGILVEVSGESGGPCHAVIGLGLNFYLSSQQAESIDQPWVDMSAILGENAYQRRNELLALLLNQLLPVIAEFGAGSIRNFVEEWQAYDVMRGKAVNVFCGEQCFTGIAAGIDDDGLFLLKEQDGKIRAFASGEVSVRVR